jgi:hypothetical protein
MQSSKKQKRYQLIVTGSMMAGHIRRRPMTQAEYIHSINPSTKEIMGSYQLHTEEQIEKTL